LLRYNDSTNLKEEDPLDVLEEFRYGTIEPAEYDTSPSKEYQEILQLIHRNEEKLLVTIQMPKKTCFPVIRTVFGNFRQWLKVCFFRTASALGPE
jgi:hypothetical protein